MRSIAHCLIVLILLNLAVSGFAQTREDLFHEPPDSARPRIWWYWGESVTTNDGITKDLEAIRRVGLSGVILYEQVFTNRPDALKSLSPEWLERVKFAAAECARLHLSLEVNSGSGYVAGGPWITPELGMQRLVGSETRVDGGQQLNIQLPQPPTKLDYYRDVAVLAYPSPANAGESVASLHPRISSNTTDFDATGLFNPENAPQRTQVRISPRADRQPVLVTMDYTQPATVRSLSYTLRRNTKALVIATELPRPFPWRDDFFGENMRVAPAIGQLECSQDGQTWEKICDLPPVGYLHDSWERQTLSFPAHVARWYRLNLHDWGHNYSYNDDNIVLTSVDLSGEARIDQWEKKSGNVVDLPQADRTPAYQGNEVIDPDQIVDLTASTDTGGKLTWNAPAGQWTVLRIGHTPTGMRTKHGRVETMGLECDKLSAAAAKVQFDNYAGRILAVIRGVPGARLTGVQMDSAEHGAQNWTPLFRDEFRGLRGYDLLRYLPAMLGRVVSSPERSDRFLYDVRRTIADLMSTRYYGTFRELCKAEGMTLMAQAPGIATCLPSDNFQAKGQTDIPMGEFWMTQTEGNIDCLETAMASHVYGKPIAAAEAFTGSRANAHPAMMKPFADAALSLGINRLVVLAYVHQPWDDRLPGVTEAGFYVPYQRHNTWWDQSSGFWKTISRSCYMLQQGKPIVDLLYHLGNDTPLKITTFRTRPVPPAGYAFDACGDEVLVERLSVRDGRFVLPDGMNYRMLVLAGGDRLTLAALRKLHELVGAGGIVLGSKPTGTPDLMDESAADEFRRLTDELWGASPVRAGLPGPDEHTLGSGRVMWGITPAEALAKTQTPHDFEFHSLDARPADLLWTHRRDGDTDFYFIANHLAQPCTTECTFRVSKKSVELWYPQSGQVVRAAEVREDDGRTIVAVKLEPHESVFLVFSSGTGIIRADAQRELVSEMPIQSEVAGPWELRFPAGRGAPPQVRLPSLISLTEHTDPGVSHFSGTVTYSTEFTLDEAALKQSLVLDLGRVEVLARVTVNGNDLGVVWKPPDAVDLTGATRLGVNRLEVEVTNLWVNRLIADSALPENQRITWTTYNPYRPTDKLMDSGLLGPVRVRVAKGREWIGEIRPEVLREASVPAGRR
ncbi:MAG TPA: glycosyl hydrolase [Tepidisphaeraceae bacterium]|nr:glycosyl hydrolase [Tepidisphaeraceae bacterium]